jgi:hypothetical protein
VVQPHVGRFPPKATGPGMARRSTSPWPRRGPGGGNSPRRRRPRVCHGGAGGLARA